MKIAPIAFVLAVGCAGQSLAAPLAPTKPSQTVVLKATNAFAQAPCLGTERRVNLVENTADGSSAEFTIPAERVLVLTGGTWFAQQLPANTTVFLRIGLRGSAPGSPDLVFAPATADANGVAAGSFTLQPGVVVKSGASLCVTVASSAGEVGGSPNLYGFLTKDK
jgi:hypothetical protein